MVYAQVHWKVVFVGLLWLLRYLLAHSLPNFAQFAGGILWCSVTTEKESARPSSTYIFSVAFTLGVPQRSESASWWDFLFLAGDFVDPPGPSGESQVEPPPGWRSLWHSMPMLIPGCSCPAHSAIGYCGWGKRKCRLSGISMVRRKACYRPDLGLMHFDLAVCKTLKTDCDKW